MTMLMTLTRSDAIAHAKYAFRALAQRAYDAAADERERAYVVDLAQAWEGQLAGLPGSDSLLTEDETRVLDHLTLAVADLAMPRDALIPWVDAFPSAVAEMFAADAEFEVFTDFEIDLDDLSVDGPSDSDVEEGADNRQSTLALAA